MIYNKNRNILFIYKGTAKSHDNVIYIKDNSQEIWDNIKEKAKEYVGIYVSTSVFEEDSTFPKKLKKEL